MLEYDWKEIAGLAAQTLIISTTLVVLFVVVWCALSDLDDDDPGE